MTFQYDLFDMLRVLSLSFVNGRDTLRPCGQHAGLNWRGPCSAPFSNQEYEIKRRGEQDEMQKVGVGG